MVSAKKSIVFTSVLAASFCTLGCAHFSPNANTQTDANAPAIRTQGMQDHSFENPIMNTGADPWAIYSNGRYYLTMTTGSNVTIWESQDLTNISQGTSKVVWQPPSGLQDIWAPELHHIGNRWYIYVAADKGGNNASHRMYVLESTSNNAMGNYKFMGQITSRDNHWAIDGTVLTLQHQLYFIWSGWAGDTNGPQNLYIAKMFSPTQISSQRVEISTPTYPWETSVAPINEGPEILKHGSKVFIIYSANASWTNAYCLGMLTLKGTDPMRKTDWVKSPQPVFKSTSQVFGPGHASFTVSPNGKQDWIVYHAARFSKAGWNRDIRTQPFTWTKSGTPDFGKPVSTSTMLSIPAGEPPYSVLVRGKSGGHSYSFDFAAPVAGNYNVYVHYANSGPSGVAGMTVNGKEAYGPYLTKTGASTSYQMAVTSAQMSKGTNSVVLHTQHLTAVHIDSVWVSIAPAT